MLCVMYVLLPGFSHIRTPGVSGFSGLRRISDLAFFWIFQNFFQIFPDFILVETQSCFSFLCFPFILPKPRAKLFRGVCTIFFAIYVQLEPKKARPNRSPENTQNGAFRHHCPGTRHSCGKTGRQKGRILPIFSG